MPDIGGLDMGEEGGGLVWGPWAMGWGACHGGVRYGGRRIVLNVPNPAWISCSGESSVRRHFTSEKTKLFAGLTCYMSNCCRVG